MKLLSILYIYHPFSHSYLLLSIIITHINTIHTFISSERHVTSSLLRYVLSFHFVCDDNDDDDDDDGGNMAHTICIKPYASIQFHGLDNHNHKTYSIKHK